jgi:very-short-patch-repair endonuclease
VDGSIHDDQRGYDEARDQIIAGRGLRILRLSNDDVLNDLQRTLQQIETFAG